MTWAGNWKCFKCAAAVASLYDVATSGPGAATSGAGAATSGAQPPIVVAAAETAPHAVTPHAVTSSLQEKTYDSFDSMHCDLRKKGFIIRTRKFVVRNGITTEQLRAIYWTCSHCVAAFTAHTTDGEEFVLIPKDHGHDCPNKPQPQTSPVGATVCKHSHELGSHPGLQRCIEEMGAGQIIRADQIADQIRMLFPGVTVVKELISRLARKAHEKMHGKGVSDVLLLRELVGVWEERGGSFSLVYGRDLGKTGIDADKMIGVVWIAPYAHLLVQAYGDLFGADGTHGMSLYGWKAIPFAPMNSLDNPHPVMVILATSENAEIVCHGTSLLHSHLVAHAVNYPPFAAEVPQAPQLPALNDDSLHEDYICPPEWRNFVNAVLQNAATPGSVEVVQMPSPNANAPPPLLVDGGTGLDLYARRYALPKVECKIHLDSHNHIQAGELK